MTGTGNMRFLLAQQLKLWCTACNGLMECQSVLKPSGPRLLPNPSSYTTPDPAAWVPPHLLRRDKKDLAGWGRLTQASHDVALFRILLGAAEEG